MIKKFLFVIFVLTFFSCQKETKCIKKYRDERFITSYSVTKDTCNTFNNYSKVSYYKHGAIKMSGYGDIVSKQGNWEFFNDGKIYTNGLFENSNPIGKWNYKNLKDIDWKVYEKPQDYSFSIPKDWTFYDEEDGVTVFDSPKAKDSNLYINAIAMESEDSLLDLIMKIEENENQKGSYNFIYKKLNIEGFENAYEIEMVSKVEDLGFFQSKAFLYAYDGKIYRIFGNVKEGADYGYNLIREQILGSFKINKSKK